MVFEPYYPPSGYSERYRPLQVGPGTAIPSPEVATSLVQSIERLGCYLFDANDHITQTLQDPFGAGSAPDIKLAVFRGIVSSKFPTPRHPLMMRQLQIIVSPDLAQDPRIQPFLQHTNCTSVAPSNVDQMIWLAQLSTRPDIHYLVLVTDAGLSQGNISCLNLRNDSPIPDLDTAAAFVDQLLTINPAIRHNAPDQIS